jgi:hypothetical protein
MTLSGPLKSRETCTLNIPSVKTDDKYKDLLADLQDKHDIPEEWQNTPIEAFIHSQNLGWAIQTCDKPQVLIATCIEFRYAMPVPRNYAYVIRRASGRVIGSEFSVGYTIAKGVNCLIMVGHNDCGMSKVDSMAPHVVQAFVDQGWSQAAAEAYVWKHARRHAITDELEALEQEYKRLRSLFPKLIIAPLFVCLYDGKLRLPSWYKRVRIEERENPVPTSVPDEAIHSLP